MICIFLNIVQISLCLSFCAYEQWQINKDAKYIAQLQDQADHISRVIEARSKFINRNRIKMTNATISNFTVVDQREERIKEMQEAIERAYENIKKKVKLEYY